MKRLTNEQLQDMSSFVGGFVTEHLTKSLQEQRPLTKSEKEILELAAAASAVAVAAAYLYIKDIEDGKLIS